MKFNFKTTPIVLVILAYLSTNSIFATQDGPNPQAQPLSLKLALKEYQIFHAKGIKEERVRLFCDQYHILQREELWPLVEKKNNYNKISDLAALSFEGDLLIVFNPKTAALETYDILSGQLQRSDNLRLKDSDKFDNIGPIAPGFMAYDVYCSYSRTLKSGNTSFTWSGSTHQLFLLCLTDGKIVQLSDNKYLYSHLGKVQSPGWNFFTNMMDNKGNIYIYSSIKAPKDSSQTSQTLFINPDYDTTQKTRVWRYNIASEKKEFLYTLPYHLTHLTFDSTGQLVFAENCVNRNENYFEVDNALRLTSIFSVAKESSHDFKGCTVFPHHKTMVQLDRRFTDKRVPVLYQWGSGFPTYKHLLTQNQIGELKSDVRFAVTHPEQPDQLLYLGTEYDQKRIEVYGNGDAILLDQFMKIANITEEIISLMPSSNFKRMIVGPSEFEGDNNLTVYDIDRVEKKITPIFSRELNIPRINKLNFSKPVFLEIPAMDGTIMPGYLTLPNGFLKDQPLNHPVFMYIHGGPHARDTSSKIDPMVHFLASRKMAVLQVNYPGSTGFGKAYQHASDGHWDKVIKYIHDARDWLVKEMIANPEKIAIGGTSFGAYATVASLQRYPLDYECGIAVNGIYNLPLELNRESQPEDNDFDLARQFSGIVDHHTPQRDRFLKRLSPALNEDKILTPLLLLHATADLICPLEQAESLVNNHPEMRVMYGHFKDDQHNLQKVEHRLIEAALTEWFLSKHLGTFSAPLGDVLKIKTFEWKKRNL